MRDEWLLMDRISEMLFKGEAQSGLVERIFASVRLVINSERYV